MLTYSQKELEAEVIRQVLKYHEKNKIKARLLDWSIILQDDGLAKMKVSFITPKGIKLAEVIL